MKQLIQSPPRTIMEVFKSLPEGTLAELIDNQIYMSPSPVYNHQEILLSLASQLKIHVETSAGKVAIAPFDVYLDETGNAVQPDIVVILKNNKGELKYHGHFHGIPDIVVEILSPNNRDHDMIRKKDLYERFGVREYWIVDPANKSTILYELADNRYTLIAEDKAAIKSKLLDTTFSF